MKIINIYILILVFVLLVSACGRRYEENEYNYTTRVLSIHALESYVPTITLAARMLNASWRARGYPYALVIDFQTYGVLFTHRYTAEQLAVDRETRESRLRMEIMSGFGPDLILNGDLPLYQFATVGLLEDFNTLIDNCHVTSRDEFFMNVLEAFEFRGGVYSFPMNFKLTYVGISQYSPQHFVDRFVEFSYFTLSDVMCMYLELLDNYDFMYIGMGILADINPFLVNMNYFIDLNVRTTNFNHNEIIEQLELSNMFLQRVRYSETLWGHPLVSIHDIRNHALSNMFYFPMFTGLLNVDAFLCRDIPFTHFIPLADNYGRLIVDLFNSGRNSVQRHYGIPSTAEVWIVTGGNADLAWEFTRYLIRAFSEIDSRQVTPIGGFADAFFAAWGRHSFRIPIKRSLFENHMQIAFNEVLTVTPAFGRGEVFVHNTEIAIARMYAHANMPMTLPEPLLPSRFIMTPFNDFSLGLIGAQEASNRMENSIGLWLIE